MNEELQDQVLYNSDSARIENGGNSQLCMDGCLNHARARVSFVQLVDRDLPMSGKGSARMAATEFAERKKVLRACKL